MNGNEYAQKLVQYLQTIMQTIGIEPERLKMIFISAAEGERFRQLAVEMDNIIRRLGPSKLRLHQIDAAAKAAAKKARKKAVKGK